MRFKIKTHKLRNRIQILCLQNLFKQSNLNLFFVWSISAETTNSCYRIISAVPGVVTFQKIESSIVLTEKFASKKLFSTQSHKYLKFKHNMFQHNYTQFKI